MNSYGNLQYNHRMTDFSNLNDGNAKGRARNELANLKSYMQNREFSGDKIYLNKKSQYQSFKQELENFITYN